MVIYLPLPFAVDMNQLIGLLLSKLFEQVMNESLFVGNMMFVTPTGRKKSD